MWHLNEIPKVLHVYWGGGKLPYLRYLTIASFHYYNPDWNIVLYKPTIEQPTMSWTSTEQRYGDNYDDFSNKVNGLGVIIREMGVIIREIDFGAMGFNNNASEVHKSDFLRWKLLFTTGGLWADMDILFIKPMDELYFNTKENSNINTVFCICEYGHSIGFLMGSGANQYFRKIHEESFKEYKKEGYQCIGSLLCNKLFPTIDSSAMANVVAWNLRMDIVYAYDCMHVNEIFSFGQPQRITQNTIGIHWYAGHSLAGKYLNETNGGLDNDKNFLIDRYIKQFINLNKTKELFNDIYKNNSWKSIESVSGTGSELASTVHLREQLPGLFKKYGIKRVLDVGCGDFHWQKDITNELDYYLGIDLVDELIDKNNIKYGGNNIEFKYADIQTLDLSKYNFDAVLVCDVLVHLPYNEIKEVLNKLSQYIKYAFITHFTEFTQGFDISVAEWRPINFTIEPFNFPQPLESIPYDEPYDIGYGIKNDKTLSLWRLK